MHDPLSARNGFLPTSLIFLANSMCVLSHVQLFVTLWTVAHEAPLSMHFLGKNAGVGCLSLLKEILATQGSNLCLLFASEFFIAEPSGKPQRKCLTNHKCVSFTKEKTHNHVPLI